MNWKTAGIAAALTLTVGAGCAKKPTAPFDQLPQAQVTAYRLQNYEPPPSATPAAATPGVGAVIPGLPPEIAGWAQTAIQSMPQLLPPGFQIPGMPSPVAAPAPAPETVPRFHGFRILGQTQVIDDGLRKELASILGSEKSFGAPHPACQYSEIGVSFASAPGQPTNDVLISFSCNQVMARTFAWPYASGGMQPETVQELSSLVNKLFPPGT